MRSGSTVFLIATAWIFLVNDKEVVDTITIWGPIPAPMERKANRFPAHMVMLAQDRAQLHLQLRTWWPNLLQQKPSQMKLSLDIDPQELS